MGPDSPELFADESLASDIQVNKTTGKAFLTKKRRRVLKDIAALLLVIAVGTVIFYIEVPMAGPTLMSLFWFASGP